MSPSDARALGAELSRCLALVAPIGMTEEAKQEWFSAAATTIGHLPADLLAIGCTKARRDCDHPSKIVPAILAEVKELYDSRRRNAAPEPAPVGQIEKRICTPKQAEDILRETGILNAVRRA